MKSVSLCSVWLKVYSDGVQMCYSGVYMNTRGCVGVISCTRFLYFVCVVEWSGVVWGVL